MKIEKFLKLLLAELRIHFSFMKFLMFEIKGMKSRNIKTNICRFYLSEMIFLTKVDYFSSFPTYHRIKRTIVI